MNTSNILAHNNCFRVHIWVRKINKKWMAFVGMGSWVHTKFISLISKLDKQISRQTRIWSKINTNTDTGKDRLWDKQFRKLHKLTEWGIQDEWSIPHWAREKRELRKTVYMTASKASSWASCKLYTQRKKKKKIRRLGYQAAPTSLTQRSRSLCWRATVAWALSSSSCTLSFSLWAFSNRAFRR